MKVLVFGSRHWLEQRPVQERLRKLPPGTIIIHGACRGADNIAGYVAEALGFTVRSYPALWDKHGKMAGFIRNQQMLDEEHLPEEPIDLAIAFDLGGNGTDDMRKRATSVGIPVETIVK
jgi:hypothetical protein